MGGAGRWRGSGLTLTIVEMGLSLASSPTVTISPRVYVVHSPSFRRGTEDDARSVTRFKTVRKVQESSQILPSLSQGIFTSSGVSHVEVTDDT